MGEWRRVRIGDFLHRIKYPVRLRDDETYKLVTVRMHHKGVVLRETKKGKLIGSNMYRVRSGQFILSGIDARHGAFGVVPDELDGAVVTNDFWYFDVDDAVVARDFFLWLTTTPLFLDACIKSSEGTTNRRRLQAERFFNFAFRFPDITEQHRLAERFTAFDATHSALKGEFDVQSDFLKQLRQAVLQEAVEGKLTADWRKEFVETQDFASLQGDPQHDAAALLAQIKAEKERLVKAGKGRKERPLPSIAESDKPFDLPAGWVWCRLGDLRNFEFPLSYGVLVPGVHVEDGIPFVRVQDLDSAYEGAQPSKRISKALDLEYKRTKLIGGEILICVVGSIGKIAISPDSWNGANIARAVCRLMPNHMLSKEYLHASLNSPFVQSFFQNSYKSIQPTLNVSVLEKTLIPLPPLAEQKAIVARVNSLLAMIDELEQQVAGRKEQAQMLMQAVLREAFAGGEGAEASDFLPLQEGGQEGDGLERRQPLRGRPIPTPAIPLKGRVRSGRPGEGEDLPLVAENPADYKARGQAVLPTANQPVLGGIPARILAAMQPGRDYSRADLLAVTGISEADWIWAIRQLKEQGRVIQKGEKRGARYSLKTGSC